MTKPTEWYRTGEARIVPSWFGFMRAEVMERRDFYSYDEVVSFQTRWINAGSLPFEYDVPSPFGFWSTMSTPGDDPKFGDRSLWRNFISFWSRPNSRVTHSSTRLKDASE